MNSERQFGEWLRYHRKQHNLSQREVAHRIGVGQTTIANYENNSRFPDQRKLVALAQLFHASLDQLLGGPGSRFSIIAPTSNGPSLLNPEELLELLLSGRETEGWSRVEISIAHGTSLATLYGDLLEPVLVETGRRWASGQLNIAEEHLVSNLVESFMERARSFFPKAVPRDLTCVCATVPGENHGIGLKMFRDLLELSGWATFFLGTNVPTDQFIRFTASFQVNLIALSVMLEAHLDSARLMIEQVRRSPQVGGIPILIGGGALARNENLWQELGADGPAKSMDQGISEAWRLSTGKEA